MKKTTKPRVLFIVPLPPMVHGSSVMCQYIKDSRLINERFVCDYVDLATTKKNEEMGTFKFAKVWRFLYAFFNVLFKLLTRRYDLCYVALAFKSGLLKDAPFVLLCKLFRRKVVIHLHGKGAMEGAKKRYYRRLLKVTFKNTKVIMLSWLLYPDVEQFVPKEDVSICPNGIPGVNYEYHERHSDEPKLLFLSNLIVSKGVIVLLDALKILVDKGYSFSCSFVGGETKEIDSNQFAEEVAYRSLDRVVYYDGKKYGDEKEKAFTQSDVFVFPTFYDNECFPLVLIEAMQHGLPVVTTNEGAIADIVIDGVNGFICEKENAESLADCIAKLITDKELRLQMGKTNYEKYMANYTIKGFEETLYDIFLSLLNKI